MFEVPSSRRPRALALSADVAALRALRRTLEGRGFDVLCADDAESGVGVLLEELLSLDALVIAGELPDRSARSVAELVRRAGGEQDLALVVLADGLGAAERTDLLALGVDAVVEQAAGDRAHADAVVAAIEARRAAPAGAAGVSREEPALVGLEQWALTFCGLPLQAA